MHILFLTDNFPPEVNAPASRTFEHCQEWIGLGHRVTVITCVPNFPTGMVFDGYRNLPWQTEWVDGIRVIRVWTFIAANAGFWRRSLDYVSYAFTATIASLFVSKPQLVVGTSPQFFTACAAYLVGLMKRIPFVFEVRDLWPESIKAVGALNHSGVLAVLEKMELWLYRRAALIIAVTGSFKKNMISRGVPEDKIEVVTNGVDMARFKPLAKDSALLERYGLREKFVVGYVGTQGMAHGLETILDAAEKIRACDWGDRVRFVLLGDGAAKKVLIQKAAEKKLENLIFIDTVSKDQVARYWSLLDVSIIHLKKNDLFTSVIPSKLFECMGMGLPVLHGVAGESAEIVEKHEVGIVFEPENARSLCEGILKLQADSALYEHFKSRCLAAASRYSRPALARKMLDALLSVVDGDDRLQGEILYVRSRDDSAGVERQKLL